MTTPNLVYFAVWLGAITLDISSRSANLFCMLSRRPHCAVGEFLVVPIAGNPWFFPATMIIKSMSSRMQFFLNSSLSYTTFFGLATSTIGNALLKMVLLSFLLRAYGIGLVIPPHSLLLFAKTFCSPAKKRGKLYLKFSMLFNLYGFGIIISPFIVLCGPGSLIFLPFLPFLILVAFMFCFGHKSLLPVYLFANLPLF